MNLYADTVEEMDCISTTIKGDTVFDSLRSQDDDVTDTPTDEVFVADK